MISFFERDRHELVIDAVLPFPKGKHRMHRVQVYRPRDGSGELIFEYEPVPNGTKPGIATMGLDHQEMEYMLQGLAESQIERKTEPLTSKEMTQRMIDDHEQMVRRQSGLVVFAT